MSNIVWREPAELDALAEHLQLDGLLTQAAQYRSAAREMEARLPFLTDLHAATGGSRNDPESTIYEHACKVVQFLTNQGWKPPVHLTHPTQAKDATGA